MKLAGLNCELCNVVPTGTATTFDTEAIIYKDDLQQYGLNVLNFVLNWDTSLVETNTRRPFKAIENPITAVSSKTLVTVGQNKLF